MVLDDGLSTSTLVSITLFRFPEMFRLTVRLLHGDNTM